MFKMGKSPCACITFSDVLLAKASHVAKSFGSVGLQGGDLASISSSCGKSSKTFVAIF